MTPEDQFHHRLSAVEKHITRLRRNPAPTIPKYDLSVPTGPICQEFGYNEGTGNTYSITTTIDLTNYALLMFVLSDNGKAIDAAGPDNPLPSYSEVGGAISNYPFDSSTVSSEIFGKKYGIAMPPGTYGYNLTGTANWSVWLYGCPISNTPFFWFNATESNFSYGGGSTEDFNAHNSAPFDFVGTYEDPMPKKWLTCLFGEGGTFTNWIDPAVVTIRSGTHGGYSYAFGTSDPTVTVNGGGVMSGASRVGFNYGGWNY